MVKFSFALIALLLLQACAPAAVETPPATNTPLAIATADAATAEPATAEPTLGADDGSGLSGLEAILFSLPGNGSVITSPVTVQGQSRPTFEQNLVVAVYDENGQVLALQPTTIMAGAGSPGEFSAQLSFIVSAEQPGRISVYETSAMDGGIVHLSSVEVTLSPSGLANILPAEFHFESIYITLPVAVQEVPRGTFTVNGMSDYYFESHLGLLLCGPGGQGAGDDLCGTVDNVLAQSFAMIDSPDFGLPGPFSGELTYTITEPTQARIVVYASSARDGGWLHVSSIPILLIP
jgi:hypothetical protein